MTNQHATSRHLEPPSKARIRKRTRPTSSVQPAKSAGSGRAMEDAHAETVSNSTSTARVRERPKRLEPAASSAAAVLSNPEAYRQLSKQEAGETQVTDATGVQGVGTRAANTLPTSQSTARVRKRPRPGEPTNSHSPKATTNLTSDDLAAERREIDEQSVNITRARARSVSKARICQRPNQTVTNTSIEPAATANGAIEPDQADQWEENYKVGYKNPPLHSRFKKGVCPNPKGRGAKKMKKQETVEELARKELLKPMTAKIAGKEITLPAIQIAMKRVMLDAAAGKPTAQRSALTLAGTHLNGDALVIPLSPEDATLLQSLLNDD